MKISVTSVTGAATGIVAPLYRLRWLENSAIDFVLPDLGKDLECFQAGPLSLLSRN